MFILLTWVNVKGQNSSIIITFKFVKKFKIKKNNYIIWIPINSGFTTVK